MTPQLQLVIPLSLSWSGLIVAFLVVSYVFWICFLAFAGLMAAKAAGRDVPKKTVALAIPFIVAGYLLDVVYNLVFGTILFFEVPKTLTLTARCGSHLADGLMEDRVGPDKVRTIMSDPYASRMEKWRGALARWLCSNLLDPFQAGGHCHR